MAFGYTALYLAHTARKRASDPNYKVSLIPGPFKNDTYNVMFFVLLCALLYVDIDLLETQLSIRLLNGLAAYVLNPLIDFLNYILKFIHQTIK